MKMPISERRQIENEMIFRRANEKISNDLDELDAALIAEGHAELVRTVDLLLHLKCECSDEDCDARLPIKLSTYQTIHENRSAFIIKLKHQVEAIEKVIKTEHDYSVVQKNNSTAEPSDDLNSTMLDKVKQLLAYYDAGTIPTLKNHEVHPDLPLGSRENYLYFTLPCCVNFQRSSPAMWASALATWQDEATRYVFFPEKVSLVEPDQLQRDLRKHNVALLPVRHTAIWYGITKTLHEFYDDDPRQLIASVDHDAGRLIQLLRVDHPERFPYLRGPKLSNYWPFILSHYTDVRFKHMNDISIIPDTHVLKASAHLGLVPEGATPAVVEAAWKALLKDSGIDPSRVHPMLWNWSRNHFEPAV